MGEQPIFTCKAHVFHIDPETKRSWLPASSAAVNVSFFYDSSRSLYRILSVVGTKAVINSTITPTMTFTKTSQKFGQWSDVRANTVYGLGFGCESELNKFIEKFQEVKEATRTSTKPNGKTPTSSVNASPVASRTVNKGFGGGGGDLQGSSSVMVTSTDNSYINSSSQQQQNELNSNLLLHKAQQSAPHQRTPSLSTAASAQSAQSGQQQQPPQDSPKKCLDKGPAPNPPLSAEAQLKYENDRLKLALAQSSANAKKWEVELSTLKSNNSRLTAALQESTANVDEWKRQLHSYKEDNTNLKMNLFEAEAGRGNCDFNALAELRSLKARIDELEAEVRERDDELMLKDKVSSHNGDGDGESLRVENDALKKTLDKAQCQLDTSLDAQDQQRKVLDAINRQFGDHLHALGELQNELSAVLNT